MKRQAHSLKIRWFTGTTAYFSSVIITLILVLSAVPLINYLTDFSRIFHRDYYYLYRERRENTGFLKVAYLLDHRKEFDSLIFGSSRVRFGFNSAVLGGYLGGNWFKLWYPGGVPYQHYNNLQALVENGFVPRQIILCLNDFDMWTARSAIEFSSNYNRRQYPIGAIDWLRFYSFYLFRQPGKTEYDILQGKMRLKRTERIAGEVYGFSASKKGTEKGRRASLRAKEPYHGRMADRKYDFTESLFYIQKTAQLCRENGIRLILVNLPSPLKNIAARNFNSIEEYQRKLVSISDYYDFYGAYDSVNQPLNWFELNHFGREFGDTVIAEIPQNITAPGRFGTLVSQANIEQHQKLVRRGVIQSIPSLLLENGNAMISESLLGKRFEVLAGSSGFDIQTENGTWQDMGDDAVFTGHAVDASFIIQATSSLPVVEGAVVRVDMTLPASGLLRVKSGVSDLFERKLERGYSRIYFYVRRIDLDKGLRFHPVPSKMPLSFQAIDLFSHKTR